MLSNLYSEYHDTNNNLYYKIPDGANIITSTKGAFEGYQDGKVFTGVDSLTGLKEAPVGVQAGQIGQLYGKLGQNAGQIGVTSGQIGIVNGQTAEQIGVVEGLQAAKTSMDETYYKQNNMYYEVPTADAIVESSTGELVGYKTSDGKIILIKDMTALTQDQYNKIGVVAGQQAAVTSIADSTSQNKVGVTEGAVAAKITSGAHTYSADDSTQIGKVMGAKAAETSMKATYLKYNNLYYQIPVGAKIQKSSTGAFLGYTAVTGTFFPMANLQGFTDEQIGKIEGAKAAVTSIVDSTSQNNVGVKAGAEAAKTSMDATYYSKDHLISSTHIGQAEGAKAAATSITQSTQENQVGVNQGASVAVSTKLAAYVHDADYYYLIPEGATVKRGADDSFLGYTASNGAFFPVANLDGLSQSWYNVHVLGQAPSTQIGKVEGAKAAQTSVSESKVGIEAGISSKDATYYKYNNYYYLIPEGAKVQKSKTGAFLGYTSKSGSFFSISNLYGLSQSWYNVHVLGQTVAEQSNMDELVPVKTETKATTVTKEETSVAKKLVNKIHSYFSGDATKDSTQIGKVEGAQAAKTSIVDSTTQNKVGVKAGVQAAKTSMNATYYDYKNMYYEIPQGAVIQKDQTGEFIGYETEQGKYYPIANLIPLTQEQYEQIGKVEGAQAAQTSIVDSTSHNNTGVIAGAQAATTSMQATYIKSDDLYYQIPAHSEIQYSSTGKFVGYKSSAGQFFSVGNLIGLTQEEYNKVGVAEGQQAAQTSMTDSGYYVGGSGSQAVGGDDQYYTKDAFTQNSSQQIVYNNEIYTIPSGASPEYNELGQLTGYYTSQPVGGSEAMYNFVGGSSQISGYKVSLDDMDATPVDASNIAVQNPGYYSYSNNLVAPCKQVTKIPGGIPQYDHNGCINGYLMKNEPKYMNLI